MNLISVESRLPREGDKEKNEMGTRNLTMVKLGGELKVAQYGQWDGYPTGQGATISSFLKKMDKDLFISKVRRLRWITDQDIKAVESVGDKWEDLYPHLSRDEGAGVLDLIHDGNVDFVAGNKDFLEDGLFCEFAYELDLDSEVVTVFESGNQFKEIPFNEFTEELMERLEDELDKC